VIPSFINVGGPWEILPPGIFMATINEIKDRYVISDHRKHLFMGFKKGVNELAKAGCKLIYLDGSFITAKPIPNDYDVCWDITGVNPNMLNPIFLDFSNKRKEQRKHFSGEFFPSHFLADGRKVFLEYFQTDRDTGTRKGIICINISKKK
jgi:hypothetical protein